MSSPALPTVDALITELVEIIETARVVPMSSSCIVGREQLLDLLDDLRDRLPMELAQARAVLVRRDDLVREALEQAQEEAQALTAAARVEQVHLVSATTVHQEATEQAQARTQEAQAHANRLRWNAESEAGDLLRQARREAATMRINSAAYADKSLADLLDVLDRVKATTVRGRDALAQRLAENSEEGESGENSPPESTVEHPADEVSDGGSPTEGTVG